MTVTPGFFISHGAPLLAVRTEDPTHQYLQRLGKELDGDAWPKAIISISAHWETPVFEVQAMYALSCLVTST
jgi:aromatic ring-opening dioxygenase catalytic subunit (LigB family)